MTCVHRRKSAGPPGAILPIRRAGPQPCGVGAPAILGLPRLAVSASDRGGAIPIRIGIGEISAAARLAEFDVARAGVELRVARAAAERRFGVTAFRLHDPCARHVDGDLARAAVGFEIE